MQHTHTPACACAECRRYAVHAGTAVWLPASMSGGWGALSRVRTVLRATVQLCLLTCRCTRGMHERGLYCTKGRSLGGYASTSLWPLSRGRLLLGPLTPCTPAATAAAAAGRRALLPACAMAAARGPAGCCSAATMPAACRISSRAFSPNLGALFSCSRSSSCEPPCGFDPA